ncbi:hypothetical protein TNCV_2541751 [Trichonephila clavipes]|nr:hypothetical protein TNCV_2541751 [Trichonephila clavipes]
MVTNLCSVRSGAAEDQSYRDDDVTSIPNQVWSSFTDPIKGWKVESTLLARDLNPGPVAWKTATAGSDVVQSGRPIFDDFFQHLWPYIGNNTVNVVLQMVKRLWFIRIDQ